MCVNIGPNIELIAANAILGVSYSILLKLIEQRVSYHQIFTLQVIVAAMIFIPIALFNPRRKVIARRDLLPIAVCAVITIYGWSLLTLRAVTHTQPIVIAELSTLGPSVTIVAAAISQTYSRRGKHISPIQLQRVLIPVIALLIVAVVVMHDTPIRSSLQDISSNLSAVVAVVSMGISTVIIANLEESYGTTTILAIYFTVALLLLPIFIPNVAEHIYSLAQLEFSIVALATLPALTLALPLYLLYRGASQLTPLHTALYRYIQPLIAFVVILVDTQRVAQGNEIRDLVAQLALTMLLTLAILLTATSLMPRHFTN